MISGDWSSDVCSSDLIGYEHDLEAQATLDTIVDRLPSYMRTKWVDKANEKRKKDERASFDTLREFIADRARASRSSHGKHYIEKLNASTSNQSVSSKTTQQTKKQGTRSKQIVTTTTLTTQSSGTQPAKKPAPATNSSEKKRECVFCNKADHHVSGARSTRHHNPWRPAAVRCFLTATIPASSKSTSARE